MKEKNKENVIGNKLRELRNAKNLIQEEAAAMMNMSRTCLSNYESGNRTPDGSRLKDMADFYGVDVNYILGLDNYNRETQEYLFYMMKNSKRITKDGFLNISDLSTMNKVLIAQLCESMKVQDAVFHKQKNKKKTGSGF